MMILQITEQLLDFVFAQITLMHEVMGGVWYTC